MTALEGISVVDLSRVLAGPLVAMTLGDLGADVVKIESPGGDDTRRWLPPTDAQGRASYHHAANRNKRSVVLDLRREPDRALARQLCDRADVVVSNFKPGTLERFELDYERVAAAKYSFLLAIPAVLGSGLFKLADISNDPIPPAWGPIALATGVAFAIGYAVIAWLLRYVSTHNFLPFVIYRLALAALVVVLLLTGVLTPLPPS